MVHIFDAISINKPQKVLEGTNVAAESDKWQHEAIKISEPWTNKMVHPSMN